MNVPDKKTQNSSYVLIFGFFGVSLLLLCYVFLRITWAVSMGPLWEAIGIVLFLSIFLQIKSVKFYILHLPKPVLKTYSIFFFIFCLCHCISIPRTTFPFVPWNMYSVETNLSNVVKFFRYEATTRSGQEISLKPEIYFRSLSNGRIVTDLDKLTNSIVDYDPKKEKDLFKRQQELVDDYAHKQGGIKSMMSWFRLNTYEENLFTLGEKKEHLNEILKAIASRYNAWHPDDPLVSIDILKGMIDISQGPQAKAVFSNVWHLSLMKGRQ